MVGLLCARYLSEPAALPEEGRLPTDAGETKRARSIADFLAGMTDRYAMAEHLRLFGDSKPIPSLLEKR